MKAAVKEAAARAEGSGDVKLSQNEPSSATSKLGYCLHMFDRLNRHLRTHKGAKEPLTSKGTWQFSRA
jgi:hypothetical protein